MSKEEVIKVCCRFRPPNAAEKVGNTGTCVEFISSTSFRILAQGPASPEQMFTFDRVFRSDVSQKDVYEFAAMPVIESVMQGFNGTVFVYGQTSSGKTHTMDGPDDMTSETMGVIPRMVSSIFESIYTADEKTEFVLRTSMFEIYNEKINDLLNPERENLRVREDQVRGIFIDNLTELSPGSEEEVHDIMKAGRYNRSQATTNMNDRSSRSHLVVVLTAEQKSLSDHIVKVGKLHLVDLAGSEKINKSGASGRRLDEAKNINGSLSALGNVIAALGDRGTSHVPYRDSKLTRVLQESLGGNSKTTLIITCSPANINGQETKSTCLFGQRAKMVKNVVKVNVDHSVEALKMMVDNKHREIRLLRDHLAQLEQLLRSNGIAPPAMVALKASADDAGCGRAAARWNVELLDEMQDYKEHLRDSIQANSELARTVEESGNGMKHAEAALSMARERTRHDFEDQEGTNGAPIASPSNSAQEASAANTPTSAFAPEPRPTRAELTPPALKSKVDKMEEQILTLTQMYQKLIEQKSESDARVDRRDKTVAQLERAFSEEKKKHAETKHKYDKLLHQCESLTEAMKSAMPSHGREFAFTPGRGLRPRTKSRVVKLLTGGVRFRLETDEA
mmetsp:Transcript_108579/g.306101  ORF Transcript_108579/g.306101 Transcript_108579/m.306101 type:complete len:621 (-) Transcript_108579:268-2130(-)|eukprot:CAMPEP_0117491852 /NCGR_PEP_ID=MMETSP0784-20121206/18279_1 /TAXON_ID=39447 /ORGANISM="" /LENGTH=620 /DNA_ID=CAMNT_0005286653 /DNA_START=87 /DNA_END=1949 /DNA_ORIENTATION=-